MYYRNKTARRKSVTLSRSASGSLEVLSTTDLALRVGTVDILRDKVFQCVAVSPYDLHINGLGGGFLPGLWSSWRRVQWSTGGPRSHKEVSEGEECSKEKRKKETENR